MSMGETRRDDLHGLYREMVDNFERLARAMEQELERLGPDKAGGEEWHKLHRAKQAAEKGAALARSRVRRN